MMVASALFHMDWPPELYLYNLQTRVFSRRIVAPFLCLLVSKYVLEIKWSKL